MDAASYTHASSKSTEQYPRHLLADDYRGLPPDWSAYASRMREYDEAMVRNWKEEVDTLLVFAGLFSAVVTAFDIEAYHLLQEDPAQTSMQLLQQISQQLAATQSAGANATTQTPGFQATPSFRPSSQSIRINALWFSSLVFALFSALVGIMVKQWTREYMTTLSLSSRDTIRLRQHRLECVVVWHVPEIMALLPLLLQVSLILFFIGLIDFLFQLQSTTAVIVTVLITIALLFYAATTLAPVFYIRSPYKSPQSWILVGLKRRFMAYVHQAKAQWSSTARRARSAVPPFETYSNWAERDSALADRCRDELDLKALLWIHSTQADEDTQDSLISFIPELTPTNAAALAYTILGRNVDLPLPLFIDNVRSRTCADLMRGVSATLPKRTRSRTVQMLLKVLEHIPRDHDPTQLGALDVLWTLWELCMGACDAEEQDPEFYRGILNGVAELLAEGEPFRLRRAALNLLWESTYQWTYLHCPSAVGNVISFARALHQHRFPDMFLKACAVALLLAPGLDWVGSDAEPYDQLRALLRELARFLVRGNEEGTQYEPRCMGRIAYGFALLVGKGVDMDGEELSNALLDSVELGLVDLTMEETMEETRALRELQRTSANRVPLEA